jgi:hypothetical protein
LKPVLRIPRSEVVEPDPVLRVLGIQLVDLFHLEEGEVALPVLGRPDLSQDGVTCAQVESLDLRRAHVDVVGPVEVIPVLGSEEPISLGQDLEHALAAEHHLGLEQALLDAEDKILLTEADVVLDVQLCGQIVQLADALLLEL